MKIKRLDFLAYGPFTGDALDFNNAANLQIIYGPNEAGKTSALRAIADALFGVPVRTNDNHVHPNNQLRIGITLETADGKSVSVVRRKAQKKTLFTADDKTLFEDDLWQQHLKNLNRETFESMFGIDHSRLRAGGAEIVKGGGQLGQLLFSAGTGLPHLRQLQHKLTERSNELFRARGKSQILQKVEDYKESQRQLKITRVSFDVWKEKQRQFEQVQARLNEIDSALQKWTGQHSRYDRIVKASRSVANWQQAHAGWARLQHVPDLPEEFADQFQESQKQRHLAEAKLKQSEAEQHQTLQHLQAISINKAVLAEQTSIERLQNELGSHEKAHKDRIQLSSDIDFLQQQIQQILLELGRDADLNKLSEWRISTELSLTIQELIPQQQLLKERLETTSREYEEISEDLERDRDLLEKLSHLPALEPLQGLLKRVQSEGDLSKFAAEADLALSKIAQKIETRLQRLPGWQGTFELLCRSSLPLPETIHQFATDLASLERQRDLLSTQLQEGEHSQQRLHEQLQQLELTGPILTIEELNATRARRDALWIESKQFLIDPKKQPEAASDTLHAFESSMHTADEIADRLRKDAERVARKQQLVFDRQQGELRLAALQDQKQILEQQKAELETDWKQLWENLPIDPLSPAEMLEWHQQYSELLKLQEQQQEQQQIRKTIAFKIQEYRSQLLAELEQIEPVSMVDAEFQLQIEQASQLLESLKTKTQKRSQLQENQQLLNRRQKVAEERKKAAETNWQRWQADWQQALQRAGMEPSLSPSTVKAILAKLEVVFDHEKERHGKMQRVSGIDQDAAAFHHFLAELRQRLELPVSDQPAARQVREVVEVWQEANRQHEQSQLLTQQASQLKSQIQQAEQSKQLAEQTLQHLCRQAHCENPDDFPLLIQQCREKQRLRELLEQSEQAILPLTHGQPLDDFIAEVQTESPRLDQYPALIQQLEQQIHQAHQERDRLLGEQTELRRDREAMAGESQAREYAAQSQSLAAAIETDIEEYARIKIAQLLLTQAMEHYRNKSQGPVLEKASHYFQRMTGGRYAGLMADFNDLGQPVLKGLRGEQASGIEADQMSDGTCDQLYLALRLASLERWSDEQATFPLIVDDILLNFDDERAAATLQVLLEFSQQTQVLFFTHHQHLLELIAPEIQKGQVHVHQLCSQLLLENNQQMTSSTAAT